MMEQNSDRLYWVIGAILVGAILIGLASVLFPHLFQDKIKKIFDGLMGKASGQGEQVHNYDITKAGND